MVGVSAIALISLKQLYIPGRDFEQNAVRALATGSYYTYRHGRIAGEVAVFDSQGPVVDDRSALAAVHGGS
jgi:hypothetical protein